MSKREKRPHARGRLGPTILLALVTLSGFAALPRAASGATITVTNTNDSGPGSLRQAVLDTNLDSLADTIAFNIPGIDFQNPSANNTVQGNYIGTDVAGTLDVGNTQTGIRLQGGPQTIGGTTPEARDVISGNDVSGVEFTSATTGVVIRIPAAFGAN